MPEKPTQKWEMSESQKILLDVVLNRQQREVVDLVNLFARELKVDPDVSTNLDEIIKNRAFTKEKTDGNLPSQPEL